MNAAGRAKSDYSKGNSAFWPRSSALLGVTGGLLALAAIGALLLIVSDFQTLYQVKVLTVVEKTVVGHDQHSFAMLLFGVAALAMSLGTSFGGYARPAMAAVALLGVVALLIALIGDLPDVNSTGVVGQNYAYASVGAKIGFWMETVGAVALIFSGASMLLLSLSTGPRKTGPRAGREQSQQSPAAAGAAVSRPIDAEDAGWL
jgi:hypothetical protein